MKKLSKEYFGEEMSDILVLVKKIKKFRDDRDWKQFHNHKDMALSLVLEATELLEHFQWKSVEEVNEYAMTHKDELADELADVAMYLFELSDNLGIDLVKAMNNKMKKNDLKYPIHKSKGKHTKYNKL